MVVKNVDLFASSTNPCLGHFCAHHFSTNGPLTGFLATVVLVFAIALIFFAVRVGFFVRSGFYGGIDCAYRIKAC
jgi:hypothetical protein